MIGSVAKFVKKKIPMLNTSGNFHEISRKKGKFPEGNLFKNHPLRGESLHLSSSFED